MTVIGALSSFREPGEMRPHNAHGAGDLESQVRS